MKMCIGWGWYISNDIFMFICSLACLGVYSHHKKSGYALIALVLAGGLAADCYKAWKDEMMVMIGLEDMNMEFYFKPYYRSGPYFLGLLLGILYRNYTTDVKEENTESYNIFYKLSKIKRKGLFYTASYLIGFALIFTLIFAPIDLLKHGKEHWHEGF